MFDYACQKARSLMYREIRNFFDARDYLEVFTPSMSPSLIPEPMIQNFSTRFVNEFEGNLDLYLIPSPEIYMKQLLSSGSPSIYQISTCFRNSEQLGHIHNPEFSMLEYYTLGYTEEDSIPLTEELVRAVALKDTPSWAKPPFRIMSVKEAVKEYSGINLDTVQEYEKLKAEAEARNLYVPEGESWDDTFNRIFITYVETSLPSDRPVVLTDYPAQIDCLAAKYPDSPYRHRWEMYMNGTEVANCYMEETSSEVTRRYYEKEYQRLVNERKGTDLPVPRADMSFADLTIPPSSGVAIGLDRLLMCMLGKEEITPLLLFPLSDIIHLGP
ncbi:MAG: amino acid--tRNA ligase-related protein [Bullifex sp.]